MSRITCIKPRSRVGRPVGTTKPDSRRNVLAQRYSDAELAVIYKHAEECGYASDLTGYITGPILLGAMACTLIVLTHFTKS